MTHIIRTKGSHQSQHMVFVQNSRIGDTVIVQDNQNSTNTPQKTYTKYQKISQKKKKSKKRERQAQQGWVMESH